MNSLFDSSLKLEDVKMPNIAEFKTARHYSDQAFNWEPKNPERQIETYGFIYKCLVDNTSNPNEWLEFGPAVGRNIIKAILFNHDSHLFTDVLTIYYPENGLSPDLQSKFIWMLCKHPQAKEIKELRIVTRSTWLVSDCMDVRVMHMDIKPSDQKATSFYQPEAVQESKTKKRLDVLRKDPYFCKGQELMFFNLAKGDTKFVMYLGEDEDFVYWHNGKELYRTDHYTIWYKLNAILLRGKVYEKVKELLTNDTDMKYEEIIKIVEKYAS